MSERMKEFEGHREEINKLNREREREREGR